MAKKRIRVFWYGILLGCLPACRTGGAFQTAKGAVCGSIGKVESAVTTGGNALGIPGQVAAGLVNAALGFVCGGTETVLLAAQKTTEAVIEKPAEAVGLLEEAPPKP